MRTDGVETLLCPALTLDSRLGIGTAFPGLLGRGGGGGGGWGVFFYIACLYPKLSEVVCPYEVS